VTFWRNQVIEPALNADTERRIEEQKAWIAADPANPRPYWQLATLLRMQGMRDHALGLLLEAVRLDDGFAPAHVTLAEVYAVLGDIGAAWTHARRAEASGSREAVEILRRYQSGEESIDAPPSM
jgi:thioredoxin-like negative regulator of GroEL